MSAYRGVPLYITTGGFPIVLSLQEVDDILRKAPEPVEPEGCLGEVTDAFLTSCSRWSLGAPLQRDALRSARATWGSTVAVA